MLCYVYILSSDLISSSNYENQLPFDAVSSCAIKISSKDLGRSHGCFFFLFFFSYSSHHRRGGENAIAKSSATPSPKGLHT